MNVYLENGETKNQLFGGHPLQMIQIFLIWQSGMYVLSEEKEIIAGCIIQFILFVLSWHLPRGLLVRILMP